MKIYNRDYPDIGELVLVKIKYASEFGLIVELLEYDNIEANISSTEVSRNKQHLVLKTMKIGKEEVLKVLRIDKGYIDLTKKNISVEEIKVKIENYSKSKKIYCIIDHISKKLSIDNEMLLEKLLWDPNDEEDDEYIHPFDNLKKFSASQESIDTLNISKDLELLFVEEILSRLPNEFVKMEALIDLTCFTEHGIDGIKKTLLKNKNDNVKITLLSSPTYRLYTCCEGKDRAEEILINIIDCITTEIRIFGGSCVVKMPPFITK